MEELAKLFQSRPEAWNFIQLYFEYVHLIDDLVDEEFDQERFFRSYFLASLLYSSDYFIRNRTFLLPIEHNIINTYADSVKWEKDENMKSHADTLRHCGLDMIFKVIQIEFGWDTLRKISETTRQWNFKR